MDDTAEDRAAVQPVIDQVVFYPLSALDGTVKTIEWCSTSREDIKVVVDMTASV